MSAIYTADEMVGEGKARDDRLNSYCASLILLAFGKLIYMAQKVSVQPAKEKHQKYKLGEVRMKFKL